MDTNAILGLDMMSSVTHTDTWKNGNFCAGTALVS